jgi:hypothetical protein
MMKQFSPETHVFSMEARIAALSDLFEAQTGVCTILEYVLQEYSTVPYVQNFEHNTTSNHMLVEYGSLMSSG